MTECGEAEEGGGACRPAAVGTENQGQADSGEVSPQTAPGQEPSPAHTASENGPGSGKRHHLLKYELTEEARVAAKAHFGEGTPEDAGHAIWELQQRELRELFIKVYKTRTVSCNNKWMRGKLLLAVGLDTRWEPEWMQQREAAERAEAEAAAAARSSAEPPPVVVGQNGRPVRRAAAAAPLRWGDNDTEQEGSAGGAGAEGGRPVPRRGAAARRGSSGGDGPPDGGDAPGSKRARQAAPQVTAQEQQPRQQAGAAASPAPAAAEQAPGAMFAASHALGGGAAGQLPTWLQHHVDAAHAEQAALQQRQAAQLAQLGLGLGPAGGGGAAAPGAMLFWQPDGRSPLDPAASALTQQWAALAPPGPLPSLGLSTLLPAPPLLAWQQGGQPHPQQLLHESLQGWGGQLPMQSTLASVSALLQQQQAAAFGPPALGAAQWQQPTFGGLSPGLGPAALQALGSTELLLMLAERKQQAVAAAAAAQAAASQAGLGGDQLPRSFLQMYEEQQQKYLLKQQQFEAAAEAAEAAAAQRQAVAAQNVLAPAPRRLGAVPAATMYMVGGGQQVSQPPAPQGQEAGGGAAREQRQARSADGGSSAGAALQACDLAGACGPLPAYASPFAADAQATDARQQGAAQQQQRQQQQGSPANPFAAKPAAQQPSPVRADAQQAAQQALRQLPATPRLLPGAAQLSFDFLGLPSLSLANLGHPTVSQDLQLLFQGLEEGRFSLSSLPTAEPS